MPNDRLNQAYEDAVLKLEKDMAEFKAKLDAGTSDPERFMSLSEIENLWRNLNKSTTQTYSDMISAYLSDIDEKEVIRLKKGNSGREESG